MITARGCLPGYIYQRRGVCGVLCQLAPELFNYLAQRHQMKPTDLWIHPLPIYQKTIKASLSALCTKRPCAL